MEVNVLIKNIGELVYFKDKGERPVLRTINGAAVAIEDETIKMVGREEKVLDTIEIDSETLIIDARGRAVIPGFVDPHTHLVYAGCRHRELLARLEGKKYLEILKEGGGINQTVRLTREASFEELYLQSKKRADILLSYGTTTLEIKSGYGLSTEAEVKILKVIQKLRETCPQDIVSTFLGAHAIPPEYRDKREEYVNLVVDEMLEKARPYSEFCDIFLDEGVFNYEEAKLILEKARELGYKLKIHADELTNSGGARLAGELGAISADHLDYPEEEDLLKMKESGTVAVLLPGTGFFLKSEKKPPVEIMRKLGIPIALATDHNPGSCPMYSQSLAMTLGVFYYNLTLEEALLGVTLNAARALDLDSKVGNIKPGMQADLLILDAHSHVHLVYELGHNLVNTVIKKGRVVFSRES